MVEGVHFRLERRLGEPRRGRPPRARGRAVGPRRDGRRAGRGLPRARACPRASARSGRSSWCAAPTRWRARRHDDRRRRRRGRARAVRRRSPRSAGPSRGRSSSAATGRAGRSRRGDGQLGAAGAALAVIEGRRRTSRARPRSRARDARSRGCRGAGARRGGRARDDRPLRRARHRRRPPRPARAASMLQHPLPLAARWPRASPSVPPSSASPVAAGRGGGEDYELCFCVPPDATARAASRAALVTRVGDAQVSWIGERARGGSRPARCCQTSRGERSVGSRDSSTGGRLQRARRGSRVAAGSLPMASIGWIAGRPGRPARRRRGTVAGEPREDEQAFGGAEQGRAGGQDEAAVADVARPPRWTSVGRDHAVPDDRVGEVRVGHLQPDPAARTQRVDVAEGREVGRAVAGDRGRAGDPGKVVSGVDARAALEVFGVGALDHHEARPDARDHDPPDRAAVAARGAASSPRQEGDPPALVGEARQRPLSTGVGRRRSTLRSAPFEVILAEFREQRRDRLLPDERHARVDQRERAGDDQHARRAHRSARERAPAPSGCASAALACGAERDRDTSGSPRHLSSQSRLGTAERARAGVGERARGS